MLMQVKLVKIQLKNYYHMVVNIIIKIKEIKEGEIKWQELKQQEQQEQDIKKY